MVNGKPVVTQKQNERVINIATLISLGGNNFENNAYAQNLALLLFRSVGGICGYIRSARWSAGAENIRKGIISVLVGALAVIVFYGTLLSRVGLVADLALLLICIYYRAVIFAWGDTDFAGIAGIVLKLGYIGRRNV